MGLLGNKSHIFQLSYTDKASKKKAKKEMLWRLEGLRKRHEPKGNKLSYLHKPLKKTYVAVLTWGK